MRTSKEMHERGDRDKVRSALRLDQRQAYVGGVEGLRIEIVDGKTYGEVAQRRRSWCT